MNTPKISLLVCTRNDGENLARCIKSARELVSEIIIVDANSSDNTLEVAREFGAIVYQRALDNAAAQKNFGLSKINSAWTLCLDADETIPPPLKQEIRLMLSAPQADGYTFARCTAFLGRPLLHAGRNSKLRLRLMKTKQARFEMQGARDAAHVNGQAIALKGCLYHFEYNSLSQYLTKLNDHTSAEAQTRYQAGQRFSLATAVFGPGLNFWRSYLLKAGFLDGTRGLIWAVYASLYTFVRQFKLWDLERIK